MKKIKIENIITMIAVAIIMIIIYIGIVIFH